MSYAQLSYFGNSAVNTLPVYNNDPLTYCIGSNASQAFNHGSNAVTFGQNSNPCQVYLAQRCAQKWDGVCEYAASRAANSEYSQKADTMFAGNRELLGLTPGDILVRNTAQEKFRSKMLGADSGPYSGPNCELKIEPFDHLNPSSPYIAYYIGQNCIPEYSVDPYTIDSDPVMHKILDNPGIAIQMLKNIKNTMHRNGTLYLLKGTRLGNFYRL
jgi:hypothetical protein